MARCPLQKHGNCRFAKHPEEYCKKHLTLCIPCYLADKKVSIPVKGEECKYCPFRIKQQLKRAEEEEKKKKKKKKK
jgi:hypothetical protein